MYKANERNIWSIENEKVKSNHYGIIIRGTDNEDITLPFVISFYF